MQDATAKHLDDETRTHVLAHLVAARADLITTDRCFREGDYDRAMGFAEEVSANAMAVWEILDGAPAADAEGEPPVKRRTRMRAVNHAQAAATLAAEAADNYDEWCNAELLAELRERDDHHGREAGRWDDGN